MTKDTINGKPLHSAVKMYAREFREGQLSRREFLARATALGATTAAAYGLAGLALPQKAEAATPKMGGTVRIETEVRRIKDPRTFDWSQMANFTRGWLEYLVEYQNDGSVRGMLLKSWEINNDATVYTLNLRQGIKWSNGDDFTSADVAANLVGWTDKKVAGNSMAGRMASLMKGDKAAPGVIEVVDTYTVRLNLPKPDITIIVGMADYPAAIVHRSQIGANPLDKPLGTGPYMPEAGYQVGVRGVLVRSDRPWWGTKVYGGPYLKRLEMIDYGTDPAAYVAAAEANEIDMTYATTGTFVAIFDSLGWTKSSANTAATIVMRNNRDAVIGGKKIYANRIVRRALTMAVHNAVPLELGYDNHGTTAENHHVAPIHPAYYKLPKQKVDPKLAKKMMADAGLADFVHNLISIDDEWESNSADAVAGQLRDAGIKVKRTILPGSTFWNAWMKYPFSTTNWNMRPLGVQVLALAYRTGAPWNESAMANAEFDKVLDEALTIANVDKRRVLMKRLEEIMQHDAPIIQPYWRTLYHHTKPKLHAIMSPYFEIYPYKIYWKA